MSLDLHKYLTINFCYFLLSFQCIFVFSLRPELYRCCLCWKDDRTLLIGWANSIKVWDMVMEWII